MKRAAIEKERVSFSEKMLILLRFYVDMYVYVVKIKLCLFVIKKKKTNNNLYSLWKFLFYKAMSGCKGKKIHLAVASLTVP